MAERHDSLIVPLRRKLLRQGFRERKSPMPTYRPDLFAQKTSKTGKVLQEVVIEAEIESTLFSEHASHQLVLMREYMQHQRKRRVKVKGVLAVPKNKAAISYAKSLLGTLFPEGNPIVLSPVEGN
jgi:hypothetical protein